MSRVTLAVPLQRVDYGNSSQVVTLFSRDRGLLEGIAKGAHRIRSSFQGPFDLAVLYEVVYLERRRSGLDMLLESSVVDGFRGLRRSLRRHMLACEVLEFLRAAVVAEEPVPGLFDLAVSTLRALSEAAEESLGWYLVYFEMRALRELGFLSSVDSCARCGAPWPGGRRAAFFSASEGGLLCRSCRAKLEDPYRIVESLSASAVRALLDLAARKVPSGDSDDRAATLRSLHRCLGRSSTILLERPLKMVQYTADRL